MDKQLLDALNNLGKGLDLLVAALDKKEQTTTATSNALKSGDFGKQLAEISVSLKSVKADTQEILKKQDTILAMQKSKSAEKNQIEETGDDPKKQNSIKTGVTTILLIATAVLAIGLALKIVGHIDFVSVIGLGIAIVLISNAFTKVAEAKLKEEDAIVTGKVIVVMAIAITVSSWVLGMVRSISMTQALSAILIAGVFTVASYGTAQLVKAFKGMSPEEALKASMIMPLVLVATSVSIAFSSWALSFVKPIGFGQAITAILIAGMFTVVSYGLAKLINSFKDISLNDALKASMLMPVVLIATSIAISASSWVLSFIKPIGFTQALTAILIAGMFTIISYGMGKLLSAFKDITPSKAATIAVALPLLLIGMSMAIAGSSYFLSQVTPMKSFDQFITILGISLLFVVFALTLKLMSPVIENLKASTVILVPLLFTTLSIAILASSQILSKTESIPFSKMINILAFSVVFGIASVVLGGAAFILSKVGIDKILEGGVAIVILAGVVMVSSLLIAEGNYNENTYPSWKWALGVTTSILGFGLAAAVLGALVMSGVGAVAMLAGAAAILAVAGVIVLTSKILEKGNYAQYPDLGWATGVGLTMTAFGAAIIGLGIMIVGTMGIGALALVVGSAAVLGIAETIVMTADILRKGNFTGGPTKAWAEGISVALAAFSPIYKMLMDQGILDILLGGPTPQKFADAIMTVSSGIVTAAQYFAQNKSAFVKGPSKEWADGVGTAIGAFAPVYAALSDNGIFGSNVSPEDMRNGILSISSGIITAGIIFSNPQNKGVFDTTKVPSKEWSSNVGGALASFAPVFEYMQKNSGWFTSGAEAVNEMVFGIKVISNAIIFVAKRFSSVAAQVWTTAPNKNWINGITHVVKGFTNLIDFSKDATMSDVTTFNIITSNLVNTARKLYMARNYFQPIDGNYIKNLSSNVTDYMKLASSLTKMDETAGSGVASFFGMDPVSKAASGMIKIAGAYDKLANALTKFSSSLQSIDGNKVNMIKRLTGNMAVLAAMNHDTFNEMMNTLEGKSNMFSKMLDIENERNKNLLPSVGDKKVSVFDKKITKKSKHGDMEKQMDLIIDLLIRLDTSAVAIADNTEDSIMKKTDNMN